MSGIVSRWPFNGRLYEKALANLPLCDIEKVQALLRQTPGSHDFTVSDIRKHLVYLRYTNPICDFCSRKTDEVIGNLRRCTRCGLAAYCSKICQRKDWVRHKKRCQKLDGPEDDGPQRLAMVLLNRA